MTGPPCAGGLPGLPLMAEPLGLPGLAAWGLAGWLLAAMLTRDEVRATMSSRLCAWLAMAYAWPAAE